MGNSALMMPDQIDKETFKRLLAGGDLNDRMFDLHTVNGFISREKLIQLSSITDSLESADLMSQLRSIPPQSREEIQLYQWLARATKISENKRMLYFASFIRTGRKQVSLSISFMKK
jgi:hypothetical protein